MNPTQRDKKEKGLLERASLVALCISSGFIAVFCALNLNTRTANELRPNQLYRAINAANRIQDGSVSSVSVKHERSGPIVDVAIFSADGRKYAVSVEGTTGRVLSVARHNESPIQTKVSHSTE